MRSLILTINTSTCEEFEKLNYLEQLKNEGKEDLLFVNKEINHIKQIIQNKKEIMEIQQLFYQMQNNETNIFTQKLIDLHYSNVNDRIRMQDASEFLYQIISNVTDLVDFNQKEKLKSIIFSQLRIQIYDDAQNLLNSITDESFLFQVELDQNIFSLKEQISEIEYVNDLKERIHAFKQIKILETPKYLFFCLKRFTQNHVPKTVPKLKMGSFSL